MRFWVFRIGVAEVFIPLEYGAASLCNRSSTFRCNIVVTKYWEQITQLCGVISQNNKNLYLFIYLHIYFIYVSKTSTVTKAMYHFA
jgi:hypothetical protein